MSYVVDIAVLVVLFFVSDKLYGEHCNGVADFCIGLLLWASLFTIYVWYC